MFCHLGSFIVTGPDRACAIRLPQGEMEMPYRCEVFEHRIVNGIGPGGNAATMGNTDIKAQASNREVLLVLDAISYKALQYIGAIESEYVIRVVGHLGFEIDLAAGAKYSQAQLVRDRMSLI